MKIILSTLLVLLTRILVSQAISYTYSQGSTIVGDVRIETLNNGNLYCDSMICPGTSSCVVTKRNDPNNFNIIIRNRKCLDVNGDILSEEIVYENNPYNSNVNMQVVSGGRGRPMTPEEQRELEEYFRYTQQRVQNQISQSMNQLQLYLSPFLDGTFAANLNHQIRSSMRNAFF